MGTRNLTAVYLDGQYKVAQYSTVSGTATRKVRA